MESLEDSIIVSADKILKKQIKRKVIGCENEKIVVEPIWMTEEIKNEIKQRKSFNRQKWGCEGEEEARLWRQYWTQKDKVHDLIKYAITEHEIKVTTEVREAKDNGGNKWELMTKLQDKGKSKEK